MKSASFGDPVFDKSAADYAAAVRVVGEGRGMELLPRDLAVLILLKAKLNKRNGAAGAFTESEIRNVYRSIDDIEANSSTVGFESRYGGLLNRLVESGCLIRSNTQLIAADDPEHILTGIGEAIAEWNTDSVDMSGESLMSILEAFNAQLSVISERSKDAEFDDDWNWIDRQIRWVLTSMLRNVHEHQTMLDMTFSRITEIVPVLLEKNNDEAIDECEEILDRVVKTISDLYRVIHQAANTAYTLIERIESVARASPECPAGIISHCGLIASQISAITEWTLLRQKSWVEHHAFIHQFVRNVIRVDRDRRITDALKRGLVKEPWWSLSVSDMPKAIVIKDEIVVPSTRRSPRREKKPFVMDVVESESADLRERLDKDLSAKLKHGEARLSELLGNEAKAGTSLVDLARAAPWIMGRMVESARPDLDINDWEQVQGTAEVQELIVRRSL